MSNPKKYRNPFRDVHCTGMEILICQQYSRSTAVCVCVLTRVAQVITATRIDL